MRKLAVSAVLCSVLFLGIQGLRASGPLGVYAIVDKVVFEPNETSPQQVQIWGVFMHTTETTNMNPALSSAERGYVYYSLPGPREQADTARKEWNDLKTVAGTGQAVGFGSGFFAATETRVHTAAEKAATPSPYHLNMGVLKLSDTGTQAALVKQLKDAARK